MSNVRHHLFATQLGIACRVFGRSASRSIAASHFTMSGSVNTERSAARSNSCPYEDVSSCACTAIEPSLQRRPAPGFIMSTLLQSARLSPCSNTIRPALRARLVPAQSPACPSTAPNRTVERTSVRVRPAAAHLNVRPHMKTDRFVSIERSAKRFPSKAARVLLVHCWSRPPKRSHQDQSRLAFATHRNQSKARLHSAQALEAPAKANVSHSVGAAAMRGSGFSSRSGLLLLRSRHANHR